MRIYVITLNSDHISRMERDGVIRQQMADDCIAQLLWKRGGKRFRIYRRTSQTVPRSNNIEAGFAVNSRGQHGVRGGRPTTL